MMNPLQILRLFLIKPKDTLRLQKRHEEEKKNHQGYYMKLNKTITSIQTSRKHLNLDDHINQFRIRKFKEGGIEPPQKKGGAHSKITIEMMADLLTAIEEEPAMTQAKMAEFFNKNYNICVSGPTISRKLSHMDITWKVVTRHNGQLKGVEKINSQPQIEKIAIFPKSLGNRLEVKLKILRKMMSIKPWSCYPLKIIFFEESAYRLWLKQANEKPKRSLSRTAGVDGWRKQRQGLPSLPGEINKPLDVNNDEAILEDYEKIEEIRNRSNNCESLECFLYSSHSFNAGKEDMSYNCRQILPDRGSCPACYTEARWDKRSISSKSEDEHTEDTVVDEDSEDNATSDERISNNSSAKDKQVKASRAQENCISTCEKNRKDDSALSQSESVASNILASLAPLAKPKFLATRKEIQKIRFTLMAKKLIKPSYKKVDPDEDEAEDEIVQMMDELE
ncbi:hypothetical protein PPACK8108_LOCUS25970, partial [Phakopsora pachyrhizi]